MKNKNVSQIHFFQIRSQISNIFVEVFTKLDHVSRTTYILIE